MEIKEKAKIIDLSSPKKEKSIGFKGHTTIELRDVVTGEVTKYEDDNMFTTAIGQMVSFASRHGYQGTWNPYTSHTYNLLGGLMIFKEPVDTNSLFPEAGNLPVGYGMIGDTNSYTAIPEWGIYNPQESDTSSATTKKMVWDFSTSHANNKISAVCLTHKNAGLMGAGISSYTNTGRIIMKYITTGTAFVNSKKGRQSKNVEGYITKGTNLSLNDAGIGDFCIDSTNDIKYQFRVCSDGIGIIQVSTHPESFDAFRSSTNWQSFTEDTYAADFSSYGSYVYHFYNPDEKMLYFWMLGSATRSVANNTTIKIHRFDMDNEVLTKDWQTVTLLCDGSGNNCCHSGMAITNTAIYYCTYDINDNYKKHIKKYTFTGGTTTKFQITTGYVQFDGLSANNTYIMNGLISFNAVVQRESGYYNCYDIFFDIVLEQIRYTNFYFSMDSNGTRHIDLGNIPPIDSTQVIYVANANAGESQTIQMMSLQQYESDTTQSGNTHTPCNYLGTINNLAESITKTAQQTMKVTYTITAVELE